MDNEVAPEFIYDNGLYYPAPSNYYGYVCTGMEPPSEWDDHNKFLSTDSQDLQFPAENLPCVYYTPSYDYAQSPYNPFNPYIPGAVMGNDGPYIVTQQCYTSSPYLQTVSPSGYIPVISQPGSDPLLNGSPDALLFNSGAVKYAPPLSSMSVTTTPLKVSLENLSLESSRSSSHQIQLPGKLSEGAGVTAASRKKFSPYGDMTSGVAPQISQGTEHLPPGGVSSIHSSLKTPLRANNGFTNPVSNLHGWAPDDRMRPRIQYGGLPNRSLGEQNMGPRSNKPKTQLTSPITLKTYTTKVGIGNLDGNIVVHADQYNRDDFPVDYLDAKFFVIKSYSEDDVHKSIKYDVWSSTSSGNKKLDIAYDEAQRSCVEKQRKCPVFLFFSVNASGHFCGVAEMIGPVDFHKDMDFWLQDKWTGSFPVKWHIIKDVPNSSFRHIILVNNEYRPVTSSRDTQEVPYLPGISMLTIFKNCPVNTWILDDFMYYEERQRMMQEEKSMLLGRKTHETSISRAISVPSIKPIDAIHHLPNWDEQKLSRGVVQPPIANGKEANVNANHFLESEGRKAIPNTADQDLKADNEQKDAEVSHLPSHEGQLNGTVNQPSKSDAHSSGDTNPVAEPDGKQIRSKLSLETKNDPGKNQSIPCGTASKSSPDDMHATSRHSTTDSKDKRNIRPESKGRSDRQSQHSKSDTHSSGDANPAAGPDGKQIRSKLSLETKNDLGKNQSIPIAASKSSPDGVHATSRHSATDSNGKSHVRPESKGGSNRYNSSSGVIDSLSTGDKIDKHDVITVGSMQIEITNTNSTISGTLTIGSIPIDTKGLKS